jgi:hypothetical protein
MELQTHMTVGGNPPIDREELAAEIGRAIVEPAQGGSLTGAPLLGLVVAAESYNRYTVALAQAQPPGQAPTTIAGEQIVATNLAEPLDRTGQLAAGTAVLVWPSQGLHLFCLPVPAEPSGNTSSGPVSYWARITNGEGPHYTVQRQIANGAGGFADAGGVVVVTAANVWELAVDPAATADVPAGAIVRVWEEADTAGQTQRFFFYAIHSVYR